MSSYEDGPDHDPPRRRPARAPRPPRRPPAHDQDVGHRGRARDVAGLARGDARSSRSWAWDAARTAGSRWTGVRSRGAKPAADPASASGDPARSVGDHRRDRHGRPESPTPRLPGSGASTSRCSWAPSGSPSWTSCSSASSGLTRRSAVLAIGRGGVHPGGRAVARRHLARGAVCSTRPPSTARACPTRCSSRPPSACRSGASPRSTAGRWRSSDRGTSGVSTSSRKSKRGRQCRPRRYAWRVADQPRLTTTVWAWTSWKPWRLGLWVTVYSR